ncbi:hypothetical protein HC752_21815 [Vibrio sp. S9_S30]|uniref:hypothetical protein n=1 Tax=Vibrio sp. S9_S30 TaxID=2720226 RepID=UPI0016817A37|nr:hypothetical protein [Vibrio sp. S9_S30]
MAPHRFSDIQKAILIRLAHAMMNGTRHGKSTVLNAAVNKVLEKDIHPNNFRASCKTLESRKLIKRQKVDLDWYIKITPEGYDQAMEWIYD